MEIRTKNKPPFWVIFLILFGGAITYGSIINIDVGRIYGVFYAIFGLVIIYKGILGIWYYKKSIESTIVLDENGVALNGKTNEFIHWYEIKSVDTEFYPFNAGILGLLIQEPFIIHIKNCNKKISIVSDSENIREGIQFLKNKLGQKFNTAQIPLRYKNLQYKNGKL